MSSAGGDAGNQPQNYHCYQCEQTVTILPSPNSELTCPNCNAATSDDLPFGGGGGFPIVFSSTAAANTAGGSVAFDDLSALFGGSDAFPGRSPNQFDPFAFLNNYFNTMRAGGADIQLIVENHPGGGGGGGGGGEFRFPGNLGDYFLGPGLEQLIQQLAENDPNRYGTPPAAKSAVAGLPDVKINAELLDSDSSQCAVCKDTFEPGEEAKQMPCKHIYHKDCIIPWLEMHNSCPVCRYELPTDDPDYENRKISQQQTANTSNNNNNTNNDNNNDNNDGWIFGGSEGGENQENSQTPRTGERRLRIPLQWLFRGLGSPAETSNSGGASNDTNNHNNNTSNNAPRGESNPGPGGQARQEDLD
ncbi:hypothetical protein K7X08_035054 [Anisodus acutangulus]|uniref:RING-type E3 ubiquitin transferase n=1 Tax=Anisodus acutangulus TaxID=402998 RepID=A0A9Q1LGM9_9SOLA|nr:hypothetical protein K7X08_035054 [Anisodus acutangulus]